MATDHDIISSPRTARLTTTLYCCAFVCVSGTSPLGTTTTTRLTDCLTVTLNLQVKQKVAADGFVLRIRSDLSLWGWWCCIIDWLKWSGSSFAPPVVHHSMHSTAFLNPTYASVWPVTGDAGVSVTPVGPHFHVFDYTIIPHAWSP